MFEICSFVDLSYLIDMAVSSLTCKNQDFFSSKLSFADVFFKLITLCVLSGSVNNAKLLAEAEGKAMNTATFQWSLVVLSNKASLFA